jgi:hypothetical protein
LSIKVSVKPSDHIRRPTQCPIANRIRESDSDIVRVNVTRAKITYARLSTDLHYTHDTPAKARLFIATLDESRVPKNFQLELDEATAFVRPVMHYIGMAPRIGERVARGARMRVVPA